MKNLSFSLIKYLVLLAALVLTLGNLLYNAPGWNNLFILQIVLGALYLILSVLEFKQQLEKAKLPNERFFYLPLSLISSKSIKLVAFSIAAVLLFMSGMNLMFLGGLLAMVILADLLVFVLRMSKNVYYISLFANYVLFALEGEEQVFASHVDTVEYRYGIFYLKLNNGKVYSIEVARMGRSVQTSFIEKFVLWVVCNKLHFTDEAKEKLADVIASVS
jgi:hypothetical protein